MKNLPAYRKTFAALIGAGIAFATVVVRSAPADITSEEWLGLAIAVATAVSVYLVPNEPS